MASPAIGHDAGKAWRVVWTAFVVAIFGWGVGFYGPGVWLAALHRLHDWPVTTLALAVTSHYLVSAVLITALPDAYRRFGVAPVTIAGAVAAAAGAVAWSSAQQVWHLVPAVLLSGLGWSAMSGAALNAMVAPWFERDRPKAISMAFNGASVGGLLFAPLWIELIAAVGLPRAGLVVGLATVIVVGPLALALPRQSARGAHVGSDSPLPRRLLVRQRGFLSMSVAFALGLFAQIGLFAHLIARLEPVFGATLAGLAVSLATFCAVLGRSLMGWLLGKHDRRRAAAANLLIQATGTLLLAFGEGAAVMAAGCVLFGLGVGNLTSLPPLIVQREFRQVDVGTVVALITAINQAVFAFAPVTFGILHDLDGSYISAFLAAAAVQIAAAVVVTRGRRIS